MIKECSGISELHFGIIRYSSLLLDNIEFAFFILLSLIRIVAPLLFDAKSLCVLRSYMNFFFACSFDDFDLFSIIVSATSFFKANRI